MLQQPNNNFAPAPFGGLLRNHYAAILADPPIPFKTWSTKGAGRSPQAHYRCPELESTFALPVASIAARDAWLFLPIVAPLMNAWGFEYSGSGIGWVKLNKKSPGYFMGQGHTTRKNLRDLLARPARQTEAAEQAREGDHRLASARAFAQAGRDLHADRGVLRRTVCGVVRTPAMARMGRFW